MIRTRPTLQQLARCAGLILIIPLHSHGKFERARNSLCNNVRLLDTALQELRLGALDKRVDDALVPSGVDDGHAQRRAIVFLGSGALGGGHGLFCSLARGFAMDGGSE